jgi:hypothetical protein
MRWLLPAAWVGIVTLAVPILIHLLSRDTAAKYSFPSLRFLERATLEPTRRTRLTDPLLLLVRCAILVSAVAALARPLWSTAARERTLASWTARAIIVDTSASMAGRMVGAERALDRARARATTLADSAQSALRIETAHPREAIAGAAQWLALQGGRGELTLVTDVQRGALATADFANVPPEIGIAIDVIDGALTIGPAAPPFPVRVLGESGVGDTAAALSRAHLEFVRRMDTDPLSGGAPAAVRLVGDTLVVLAGTDAYDVAATNVVVQRSLPDPLLMFEADTARTPTAVWQQWERLATEASIARAAARDERSDARWLWVLVLALLALETVLRRRTPMPAEAR